MELPVLTPELTLRLEKCDTTFIGNRIQALQKLAGNPYGAEIKAFGTATGLMIRSMPDNTLFNRIADFTPDELPRLDEIISWYTENKIDFRFDLLPSHVTPALFQTLAGRGYYHSRFYSVLYGLPEVGSQAFPGVTVRTIEADELGIFDDIYMAGFGFPESRRAVLTAGLNNNFFEGSPTRFYLALVNGTPAAIGLLLISDNIGYLATATTLAEFRGHGCQKALIQQRILDAREAGCELVTSHTAFASASQINMEKAGLRLAYNKALWTKLPRK